MRFRARQGTAGTDFQDPKAAAAVVLQARVLAGADGAGLKLMNGKRLALLSPEKGDEGATAFVQAATALGAHVSFVQPSLDEASSASQVADLARMLGQLYDAVECQHLPISLVQRIASSAGIPVFDGLATASHPTCALAAELNGDTSAEDKRRRILQAALLVSMG
jgi:ornithine carbamoyltransferase